MSFTSIPDRSNGQKISFSWFNALKEAGKSLESINLAGIAKLTRNSQTVSSLGDTKVLLNSIVYDTLNGADVITNYRYTCKKAGFYRIWGQINFSTFPSDAVAIARIRLNGVMNAAGIVADGLNYVPSYGSSVIVPIIPNIINLALNDFLELYAYSSIFPNYGIFGMLMVEYIGP